MSVHRVRTAAVSGAVFGARRRHCRERDAEIRDFRYALRRRTDVRRRIFVQNGMVFGKVGEKRAETAAPRTDGLTKSEKYGKIITVMCTMGMTKEAKIWLSMNGKTASLPRTNG